MSQPVEVARVFRCGGCKQKATFGVAYLDEVGPYPEECTVCGDLWGEGDPVFAEDPPANPGS